MPKGVYVRNSKEFTVEDAVTTQAEIPVTGSVDRNDLVREIEPQTEYSLAHGKADELAFMEEKVEIFLHESTNPNEEPIVHVGVNGDNVWLQRGKEHVIKRKHVLNLLTARPTAYQTVEGRDRDGAQTVTLRSRTAIKYPFSVVKDTPRGAAWIRQFNLGGR